MIRILPTLLLSITFLAMPAFGQDDAPKLPTAEDLALEIIEMTGGAEIGQQLVDAMIVQMRPMYVGVPEEVWAEIGTVDTKGLVDRMVPIYTQNYSREEMLGLIDFYRTPLGQRMIEVTPAVSRATMIAGGQWGQEQVLSMIDQLREKGYEPKQN